MRYCIILNPYANRWNAQKQIPKIKEAFQGLDFEIRETNHPKHAHALTKEALASGFDAIIAAGGDGTINEVVNGLVETAGLGDSPTAPLGIIPLGSANDFNEKVGNPSDLTEIAHILRAPHTTQIDIGAYTDAENNTFYFDNNIAAAMEPLVTISAATITGFTPNIRYFLGLIKGLRKLKAWDMTITHDNGTITGPSYLLSICNGKRVGSIFLMAPDAEFDDGLFDVIYAAELPMHKVIRILPRLFNGSHIHHPDITTFRTTSLTIKSTSTTPIHADGEILTEGTSSFTIKILPKKLTLLTKR